MAKAPPSGGEWNAWYARFCKLIGRYHERKDEAGRLARRLQRKMASLWVSLSEHGVEATNNRAEVRSVDQKPNMMFGGLVLGWKGGIP
jgi:transposase